MLSVGWNRGKAEAEWDGGGANAAVLIPGGFLTRGLICRTNFLRGKTRQWKRARRFKPIDTQRSSHTVGMNILMKTIHRNSGSSFMNERIFMNSIFFFFNSINPQVNLVFRKLNWQNTIFKCICLCCSASLGGRIHCYVSVFVTVIVLYYCKN